MEKPVRKRGRPPITKDYKNPLESPMAHSSLKVQRLGAQGFSRPMMKVGHFTPSPRNRRTSSCSSLGYNGGGESHMEELNSSAPGSVSRKGRFRGVLLTTPTKKHAGVSASSTPSSNDSMFQSSSRMTLKSSPPMSSSPIQVHASQKEQNNREVAQMFKFALTIGDNGRATIAGSSPLSTPSKCGSSSSLRGSVSLDGRENEAKLPSENAAGYEKKRVLSLLRQMRNGPSSSKNLMKLNERETAKTEDMGETRKDTGVFSQPLLSRGAEKDANNLSPSVCIPKSPQFPSTPRTSFTMRTGLTPNLGIDQVLLDIVSSPRAGILSGSDNHIITLSPITRPSNRQANSGRSQQTQQQTEQQTEQQQFVFKFSSADPLLMTNDIEGNWSEVMYNHVPSSPRHQICFNTPPSWMNSGSPRAFSPQRRDSNTILISASQITSSNEISNEYRTSTSQSFPDTNNSKATSNSNIQTTSPRKGEAGKPSTPTIQQFSMPTMIEYTPLIQQSMDGTITSKCTSGSRTDIKSNYNVKGMSKSGSTSFEQEDAIVALKKLITDR